MYVPLNEDAPPLLPALALHPVLVQLRQPRVLVLHQLRERRKRVLEDLVV